MDEGLKTLLDLGKLRGSCDLRPGQRLLARRGEWPEKISGLLNPSTILDRALTQRGRRPSRDWPPPATATTSPTASSTRPTTTRTANCRRAEDLVEISRRTRRSCADVPDADGRDPLAHPRPRRSKPGQEDRDHPQADPPQGSGRDYALRLVVERPQEGQRRRLLRLGHTVSRSRSPRTGEGPDHLGRMCRTTWPVP